MLLQDHQRQHTNRQTKNLQRGSSVHWGDFFIKIAAVFNDSKQKIFIDTDSMLSIIKPNLINTVAILPSTTTLSTPQSKDIRVKFTEKLLSHSNFLPYDGVRIMSFTSLMCLVISLESIFSLQIISP